MTAIRAIVSETGILQRPHAVRRAAGLENGGEVVLELSGGKIQIRALDDVVAAAQEATRSLVGETPEASVDAFRAERRRAAARE
jgi:bifunctional DNA-binding transcriptional regulator/antitoxin component of YhaV-PrlF toxin-antitoxin module